MSESRDLKKGMKLNASLAVQIIEHKLGFGFYISGFT